jgi:hypothetical protein
MHALASSILVALSVVTILALRHLHPLAEVDLSFFVNDFHPEMDLVLDREAFIYILTCFPCLSSNSPSNMVYKLLQSCFVPDDFTSGFDIFLKYEGTSFMVMFLHQYHTCSLHHNY